MVYSNNSNNLLNNKPEDSIFNHIYVLIFLFGLFVGLACDYILVKYMLKPFKKKIGDLEEDLSMIKEDLYEPFER